MSPVEVATLSVVGSYAIYSLSRVRELPHHDRFTPALVYAVTGVSIGGGATVPPGWAAIALLISVILSFFVGMALGQLTQVWMAPDGVVSGRSTVATISLLLGLVATVLTLGAHVDLYQFRNISAVGEVLVAIAVMAAAQAECIHRRALALIRAIDRVELDT